MKTEHLYLGAAFAKLLCGGEGCYTGRAGEKTLFSQHNGYDSNGGTDISQGTIEAATKRAMKHEAETGHETRLVIGHLTGTIYKADGRVIKKK